MAGRSPRCRGAGFLAQRPSDRMSPQAVQVLSDGRGQRVDRGRYGGGQAGALAHVGYLDRVQDQHARHAVKCVRETDRAIEPKPVRAGRRCDGGAGPMQDQSVPAPGNGGLGPDRIYDHGNRCTGPRLDQPGWLAVADQQADVIGQVTAQPRHNRWPGAVIAAELVTDADDNGTAFRRCPGHRRSTRRSRKCVAQEIHGS